MRKRLVLGMMVVALVPVLVAACGDDDDDDDDVTATVTEAVQESPTAAADQATAEATEPAADTSPSGTATVIVTEHAELGSILTDADGRTLYTFAQDTPGVSACVDACADRWPPLPADGEPVAGEGVPGELSAIERPDGSMQVAYDGMPLYYFADDAQPGDAMGEGVGGVWFVVHVDGAAAGTTPEATGTGSLTGGISIY